MKAETFACFGVALLTLSWSGNAANAWQPISQEPFSLSLGRASDAASRSTDKFVAGERVIVRVTGPSAAVAGPLTLVWIDPLECILSSDTKTLKAARGSIVLISKDTSSWKPGSYRLQVRRGSELIRVASFQVLAAGE